MARKPTEAPEPGYEWVQSPSGQWYQSGGWDVDELNQTAPEGSQWVSTPGGGVALQPVSSGTGQPPYPAPAGFQWVLENGTWVLKPTQDSRPPAPGAAWIWDGTKWVKPPAPAGDGRFYKWNDATGWQVDTYKMSAYDTLKSWFTEFGIDDAASGQGTLSSKIWEWIQGDKSADWIKLELRKTDQYKARFPGMEAISKKGMAISEAEYIATERAYLQVLSTAGLDKVYGNRADYGRFIAAEVSAQELAARVQIARDYVNMYAPASVKQQLRELYGMDDTQMAAYVLDTSEGKKKSLAALETEYTKRQAQAQIGGAAIDTGLGISTPLRDQIAEAGYNYNQAMTGLGRAKTEADPYRRLGNLYGVATSTDELIQENFGLGGGAEATTKKKKLASRERAAFSGSSALSAGSLAANRIGQV